MSAKFNTFKTLDELCSTISDCPHATPKWTNSGVVVIRNNNIKNGKIDLSFPSFTTEEEYLSRIKRSIPNPGDIIITREAPMGQVGMIPEGIKCCLGQRMVLLKVNPDLCDNYYLLYALQSSYVQNQIQCNEGTGTTVSNLRIPFLKKLKIPYIPLTEQRHIVELLRPLDEKIEINDKISKNLSNQIQLISNNFLSFKAPKSIKINLGDICDFHTGYSYTGKELQDPNSICGLVTIKNFIRGGGFTTDGYKPISPVKKIKDTQFVNLFDILVAHTDLTQKAEILGNAEMILNTNNFSKTLSSMDLVKVSLRNECNFSKFLLAGALKSSNFKNHCLKFANGTTVLHLNKKALQTYVFYIPGEKSLLESISSFMESAMMEISNAINQNKSLVKLKTHLLHQIFHSRM